MLSIIISCLTSGACGGPSTADQPSDTANAETTADVSDTVQTADLGPDVRGDGTVAQLGDADATSAEDEPDLPADDPDTVASDATIVMPDVAFEPDAGPPTLDVSSDARWPEDGTATTEVLDDGIDGPTQAEPWCASLEDGVPCPTDFDPCTSDSCQDGVCTHELLADCNIGKPCDSAESCPPGLWCATDLPDAICVSKGCDGSCAEGGVCVAAAGQPATCLPGCDSASDCPSTASWTCGGGVCHPRACHAVAAECGDWRSEKAYVEPTFDLSGAATVELWLRTDGPGPATLVDARSKFVVPGFGVVVPFGLILTEEGGLEAGIGNGSPTLASAGPWETGAWHHVAVSWQHQGTARLWLDGELVAEVAELEVNAGTISGAADLGFGWRIGACDPLSVAALRVSSSQVYVEPFEPPQWLLARADTQLLWRAGADGALVAELGLPVIQWPEEQQPATGPGGPCPACSPSCEAKTCGPDGCGGSCGSCDVGTACDATGTCATCVPNCEAGCGLDGCGGVCALCDVSVSCAGHPDGTPCPSDGDPCTSDTCQGWSCTSVALGGCPPADTPECAPCAEGEVCDPFGQCTPCVPFCNDQACGDDGCGGSCGLCPAPTSCGDSGHCDGPCLPQCGDVEGVAEPVVCGDDLCGGSCGSCPGNEVCSAEGQCAPCVPVCEELTCTSDGCGGVCGPVCQDGGACLQSAVDGTPFCSALCDEETVVCEDGALCVPITDPEGQPAGHACLPLGPQPPYTECTTPDACGAGLLCLPAVPEAPTFAACLPGCDTAVDACPESALCVPIGSPENATGACLPCLPVCHADGSVSATCNPNLSEQPSGCATKEKCTFDSSGTPTCVLLEKTCNVSAFGCTWTLDMLSCQVQQVSCSGLCDPGATHCVGDLAFTCLDSGSGFGPLQVCEGAPGAVGTCEPGIGCTLAPDAGHCLIDGSLVPDGTPHPSISCLGCESQVDALAWSVTALGVCQDGDPCTTDTCTASGCEWTPLCVDGNPCTDDICEAGECPHPPADGGPCEDGDACTLTGTCEAGSCVIPEAPACDDGKECTADTCLNAQCVHSPLTGTTCSGAGDCAISASCDLGLCIANVDSCAPCPTPTPLTAAASAVPVSLGGAALPTWFGATSIHPVLFHLEEGEGSLAWFASEEDEATPRRQAWDAACVPLSLLDVTYDAQSGTWSSAAQAATVRLWVRSGPEEYFGLTLNLASVTVATVDSEEGPAISEVLVTGAAPVAVVEAALGAWLEVPDFLFDTLLEASGITLTSDADIDGDGTPDAISFTVRYFDFTGGGSQ